MLSGELVISNFILPYWQMVLVGVLSFSIGMLGGTVGLALGTMRLPMLLLLDVPFPIASGTNILVSTISAVGGGIHHAKARRVNWILVFVMGIPSMVGAFIGGFWSGLAPTTLLIIVAGVFVSWQGIEFGNMARTQGRMPSVGETDRTLFGWRRLGIEGLIGFLIGLIGGTVGLILGSVRLPAIIRILHIDPRTAAGTNLVIGVGVGIFGFLGHGYRGDINLPLLISLAVPGFLGAYLGAHFTGKFSLRILLVIMSVVLFTVGVILIVEGVVK